MTRKLEPLKIIDAPGPWTYEIVGTRDLEDGSESNVCEVRNAGGDLIATVDECDAPLICAAPALLKACQLAVRNDEQHGIRSPRRLEHQVRLLIDMALDIYEPTTELGGDRE